MRARRFAADAASDERRSVGCQVYEPIQKQTLTWSVVATAYLDVAVVSRADMLACFAASWPEGPAQQRMDAGGAQVPEFVPAHGGKAMSVRYACSREGAGRTCRGVNASGRGAATRTWRMRACHMHNSNNL